MKRHINLYSSEDTNKSEDFISIHSVDNIVNFSVDHIFCDCIDVLDENIANITLQNIFKKLRIEGYAHLKLIDIKQLCLDVVQNKVPLSQLIQFMNNRSSIMTLDIIASNIDFNKFDITKMVNEKYEINIIIKRTAL